MGGGVGCRCCVCSTTAGSATLARAWLATVLLVGVVVASGGCHSRHDWALSRSGLAGFARAGLLACVVGSADAASVSMPCGQGLVRPRLRGVGAAGSGVGVGKEALVDGGMGRGCGCRRCWACRTMAWSDSLARAWLATELLMGLVEACCGRHSSRLGSGLVWLCRVYPGFLWWCPKPRQGSPSLQPVGPCRADRGVARLRLLGVGAAGSGVGGGKEALVDGGMGRGCGCRRCWACRTMAGSVKLARAWLATVLLVGTVEACCGRHSSRRGSERVGLGRVCPGLLACMCCRVGGDHVVAGKLWCRLPLVSVSPCCVGRGRTTSTTRLWVTLALAVVALVVVTSAVVECARSLMSNQCLYRRPSQQINFSG